MLLWNCYVLFLPSPTLRTHNSTLILHVFDSNGVHSVRKHKQFWVTEALVSIVCLRWYMYVTQLPICRTFIGCGCACMHTPLLSNPTSNGRVLLIASISFVWQICAHFYLCSTWMHCYYSIKYHLSIKLRYYCMRYWPIDLLLNGILTYWTFNKWDIGPFNFYWMGYCLIGHL